MGKTLKPSEELISLKWYDAKTLIRSSLQEALDKGLAINVTYGKIKYVDKNIVIICTEEGDCEPDLTVIPRSQVIGKE
jgi:hypothetical protein